MRGVSEGRWLLGLGETGWKDCVELEQLEVVVSIL